MGGHTLCPKAHLLVFLPKSPLGEELVKKPPPSLLTGSSWCGSGTRMFTQVSEIQTSTHV